MKILHVTTTLSFAGAEQVILDLSEGPWEIEVAALTRGDGAFRKRLEQRSIPVHDLDMSSKCDTGVLRRLRNVARGRKFDLVHSHLVHANTVARTAFRNDPLPVVSTVHIVETRFRPWHSWAERLSAPWASKITCVSPDVHEQMRRLRIDENKLVVIPNGVDTSHFVPPHRDLSRDIDILFLGRLDPQKGLDRLMPSLAVAARQGAPRITIAGAGPQESFLRHQASRLGLQLIWTGFVEDPSVWYRRARVVVVPSRWEGFGLTAAEALACGCDVWHSGADSLTDVCGAVGHEISRDPDRAGRDLARAATAFRENPRRREHVLAHWSAERMIHSFHRLYNEVLPCAASRD